MTVRDVLDRRQAVLRERWQTADKLGLFDVVIAADICEQMGFILDVYRALLDEKPKGKT